MEGSAEEVDALFCLTSCARRRDDPAVRCMVTHWP
jgi:hypothetical protein